MSKDLKENTEPEERRLKEGRFRQRQQCQRPDLRACLCALCAVESVKLVGNELGGERWEVRSEM